SPRLREQRRNLERQRGLRLPRQPAPRGGHGDRSEPLPPRPPRHGPPGDEPGRNEDGLPCLLAVRRGADLANTGCGADEVYGARAGPRERSGDRRRSGLHACPVLLSGSGEISVYRSEWELRPSEESPALE